MSMLCVPELATGMKLESKTPLYLDLRVNVHNI